jgi:hypothetical protein
MATVDTSLVEREIRVILASSNVIKRLLRDTLEQLETAPGSFPKLEDVPEKIRTAYPNVTLRKAKLESNKHSFRLVFAHWKLADEHEHVDVLYAFPRKRGYSIDWKWVDSWMER